MKYKTLFLQNKKHIFTEERIHFFPLTGKTIYVKL